MLFIRLQLFNLEYIMVHLNSLLRHQGYIGKHYCMPAILVFTCLPEPFSYPHLCREFALSTLGSLTSFPLPTAPPHSFIPSFGISFIIIFFLPQSVVSSRKVVVMATSAVASSRVSSTTAQPLLALLDEEDVETQEYALRLLDEGMHLYWSEIAPSIPKLYVFSHVFFVLILCLVGCCYRVRTRILFNPILRSFPIPSHHFPRLQ